MLFIKNYLNKKEKQEITYLIDELGDSFGEFYITKNGLRLFIKDNMSSLWETLRKGDKIIYGEEGVAVITGFADKTIEIIDYLTKERKIVPSRKYVTILSKDERNADRVLQFINWHFRQVELFAKLKRNNPFLKLFYNNRWQFYRGRGKELLLKKNVNFSKEFIPHKD